ncbi:alpha/beta hydrolase family protein [Mucilaginibacter yixingensis]|uniref:Alpha/beta hydrolase family protein n=1 Tax=Mucilaginibacter yixingensis TaxID=1295612 RepID=A0A2T5J9X7_9SPHI|nr:alpha/beta hydrolase [Mucilaginibacter yixingensis]PTQ96857.1 alpha/beta hydrolase family protein [Mucilaginibacter yixingensis]
MSRVFMIPGMGADSRIYQHIKTDGYEQVLVNWFEPDENDSLVSYAQKIKAQYGIADGDIVIGNSLGGMMAMEISKTLRLKKTILISSIKTINEAPGYFKLFRALPVYKILPGWLITHSTKIARHVVGNIGKHQMNLFADMLHQSSVRFLKWSMGAVLRWDNQIIPENTFHIVGDNDRVFDHHRIKNAAVVHGGTHIMIFDRAREINQWLATVLAVE